MVALNLEQDGVRETAERVYESLAEAGFETILDDREESAGVKFADADLLGLPVRVTVSPRSLRQGGVELKRRPDAPDQAELVPVAEAADHVRRLLG